VSQTSIRGLCTQSFVRNRDLAAAGYTWILDLHRVRRDLRHAGAVMFVSRNFSLPLGNGGVEALARDFDGIGCCGDSARRDTRESTNPPTNAAPRKRITG